MFEQKLAEALESKGPDFDQAKFQANKLTGFTKSIIDAVEKNDADAVHWATKEMMASFSILFDKLGNKETSGVFAKLYQSIKPSKYH